MRAILITSIAGLFAAAGMAMANPYVPNEEGDEWHYESNNSVVTLAQSSEVVLQSRNWARFTSFGGLGVGSDGLWVWSSDFTDRVYLWNYGRRRVELLADLAAPVGSSYLIGQGPCNAGAVTLAARGETVVTPAGTFDDTVRLSLQPSCADAGVTGMVIARDVGIVQWTETSFVGPRIYNLAWATVGGVMYPRPPAGFSVRGTFPELDVVYNPLSLAPFPIRVRADLEIKNGTSEPRDFTFTSGQQFDIEVIDSAGNVVSRWSRGRAFTQAIVVRRLEPGESFNFSGHVDLHDDNGAVLPAGDYTLKMLLTDVSRAWAASAALRIDWLAFPAAGGFEG